MEHSTFGRHVVADAWDCHPGYLHNAFLLEKEMIRAAEECGATVLSVQNRHFEPNGDTILLVLAESHLSIHTYPEEGYAALDCFTCGNTVDPARAVRHMLQWLQPRQTFIKRLIRGDGTIRVQEEEVETDHDLLER